MGLFDRFLGPPSRDKFARMVMEAVQQAGETAPLRYDPAEFQLHDLALNVVRRPG